MQVSVVLYCWWQGELLVLTAHIGLKGNDNYTVVTLDNITIVGQLFEHHSCNVKKGKVNSSFSDWQATVRLFLDCSCVILSSFKIWIIHQLTFLISADVLLKMTTILKELRIAQLRSKNKQTLGSLKLWAVVLFLSFEVAKTFGEHGVI